MGASAGAAIAISAVDTIVDYREKKKQQRESEKLLEQQQKITQEETEIKKQIIKDEKTNLLKTKLATQKAKLGANGLGATVGSSAAYFSRLEKETDNEIAKKTSLNDLGLLKDNANYDYRKNLNLLQKSKADYDVASGLAKSLFSKKLF
jgi:ADP-ribosylglycohydrolase